MIKFKNYVTEYNKYIQTDNDSRLNSDKHTKATTGKFGKFHDSKRNILKQVFSDSPLKLEVVLELVEHIKRNNFKNVLSLGSGTCSIEYLTYLLIGVDLYHNPNNINQHQ
jgi:hypothetical protein